MKKLGIVFIVISGLISTSALLAQNPDEVKKKTPDLPGIIVVDLGFNSWINGPDKKDTLDINWWRSKSLGIYFKKPFEFGKKFSFVPGIGVSLEKFGSNKRIKIGYQFDADGNRFLGYDTIPGKTDKNQLAINFIEIPVEFRYYITGDNKSKGLYIAGGGSTAFRFEAHTKVKFEDDFGTDRKIKERDNFKLSKVRLGVHGRLGFRSVSVFYKHYFTTIFNDGGPPDTGDMAYWTIGVSLSGF